VSGGALFVTDFADQAVVLPVALAVGLALFLIGWRPAARAWVLCVGATLSVILLLKLTVMACGLGAGLGLVSPSGHTAGAACVYGGAIGLLARGRRAGTLAAGLAALAVAGIIGMTRLWLGVHTLADVCVGGFAGAGGAAALRTWAGERPGGLPVWRCGVAALAAMLLFHGHQLNAEPRLRWAASRIWPLSLCAAGHNRL
jgi:membrane-associated phospholipid phosphatase